MVDPTMNVRQGSPLRCCNPREFRQNASPVFRQQFVSENGKMKLTMPMSPLHYITTSGYYANDLRLAHQNAQIDMQKCQQSVPYPVVYEQQSMQMGARGAVEGYYAQRMESMGSRSPTPNMQVLIQQPQEYRRASVQLGSVHSMGIEHTAKVNVVQKSQNVELTDLLTVLIRIEKKLDDLQILCKSKATDIHKKNAILMPKTGDKLTSQLQGPCSEQLLQHIKQSSLAKMSSKLSVSSETLSKASSGKHSADSLCERPIKQMSLPSITQEFTNNEESGSKVFDVSKELRKSNDMLEQFLASAGSIGDVDDQEGALQHENLKLSQAIQDMQAGQNAPQEICDQEDDVPLRPGNNTRNYSSAKPIVSTVSMALEDAEKDSMQNLEKRFQMLIRTFENNRGDNAWLLEQKRAFEAQGGNAIENGQVSALSPQELPAITGGGYDEPDDADIGEIAIRENEGELATREADIRSNASALQTQNIQFPATIPRENAALIDQPQYDGTLVVPGERGLIPIQQRQQDGTLVIPGERGLIPIQQLQQDGTLVIPGERGLAPIQQAQYDGTLVIPGERGLAPIQQAQYDGTLVIPGERGIAPIQQRQQDGTLVVPGERGLALNQQTRRTSQEYQAELQAEQALRNQFSKNGGSSIEGSNLVAKSSHGKMESQSLTCSVLAEECSRQSSLERVDSIRDLNT
ncbi:calcium channel flower homolog isoform X1, putative [Babesia ovata]|uniref:Calcium channel flower homolog isoform X1, putative n=1 Tax=Babesia ovata TaxID=189622 RepID=A0A2H6KCL8_9APIC|nr:calcium channel flower homolog isoform X1, putative [Babesia ovata]GBE60732.1 calcium channel flower homolog isoform X1, putative [Babesia ovata]